MRSFFLSSKKHNAALKFFTQAFARYFFWSRCGRYNIKFSCVFMMTISHIVVCACVPVHRGTSGNPSHRLDGHRVLQVCLFSISLFSQEQLRAFSSDSTSSRTLDVASYTNINNMTIESCIAFCTPAGYLYAGVEYARVWSTLLPCSISSNCILTRSSFRNVVSTLFPAFV